MGSQDTGIVVLGKWTQSQGYRVGEHPAFGGVGGGHSAKGYHPTGQAIDINADGPKEEERLDVLQNVLSSGDFGIVEMIGHRQDPAGHGGKNLHLHVAIVGPPTPALLQLVERTGGGNILEDLAGVAATGLFGGLGAVYGDDVIGALKSPFGFVSDKAEDVARGIVSLLFSAFAEDGARALLYIGFVTGGTVLALVGLARMAGVRPASVTAVTPPGRAIGASA